MRVFMIRHGETDSNVRHLLDTAAPGAPLNAKGHAQAEALALALAHEPIEAVYASNLTRAQETARPLAISRGLEVQVLDGLREIAAGVEEMNEEWDTYISMLESWSPDNADIGLEGGETGREFMTRYTQALDFMASQDHETIAFVSHGAALQVFGLALAPQLKPVDAPPLMNTEWILIEGSLERGWKILQWGTNRFK